MIDCPYCKEQIQDGAIKCRHCLSYVVPSAEPRKPSETADLVIKFVGVISVVVAVVGGYMAVIGLNSLADVRKQSEATSEKTRELLEEVKTRIAKYTSEFQKIEEGGKNVTNSLNLILVRNQYDRYLSIMDSIFLDKLTENSRELDEIQDVIMRSWKAA